MDEIELSAMLKGLRSELSKAKLVGAAASECAKDQDEANAFG